MMRIADRLSDAYGTGAVALLMHAQSDFVDAARQRGHRVFTVGGRGGTPRQIGAFAGGAPACRPIARRAAASPAPKVVIIPMNFALACPLALLVRALGGRLVYVVHDAEPHSGDFAPAISARLQRWLVGQAHAVVAMSQGVAVRMRELHPELPADAIDVVPLHMLAREPRRGGRPNPEGPLRLLFMGRLLPYKGLDLLAQALSQLSQRTDCG